MGLFFLWIILYKIWYYRVAGIKRLTILKHVDKK